MTIERFDSESLFGYTQITTFYEDFSIADNFGESAIRDTFRRAFSAWKKDYKYLTELVMVLNWKVWRWYEDKPEYAEVYQELWEKADAWACENLDGEALAYFYRTVD